MSPRSATAPGESSATPSFRYAFLSVTLQTLLPTLYTLLYYTQGIRRINAVGKQIATSLFCQANCTFHLDSNWKLKREGERKRKRERERKGKKGFHININLHAVKFAYFPQIPQLKKAESPSRNYDYYVHCWQLAIKSRRAATEKE